MLQKMFVEIILIALPLIAWNSSYFVPILLCVFAISICLNIASRIVMRGLIRDIIKLYKIMKELEERGLHSKDNNSVSNGGNT